MEGDPQFELKNSSFIVLAPQQKKTKNKIKKKTDIAAKENERTNAAIAKSKSKSRGTNIKENISGKANISKNSRGSSANSKASSTRSRSLKSAMTAQTSEFLPPQLLQPEADVIISYTPRFIRPSSGRLTLLAKPFPDAVFPCKIPETMTFELQSSEIEAKPIKTIQCKGKLYESSKVEFEINNPYNTDCEFSVIIKI